MDEEHQTWAQGIQAEAERLTLKRIRDDKEERQRQAAEEAKAQPATANDDKKKA